MKITVLIPKGTFVNADHPDGGRYSKKDQEVECNISPFSTKVSWIGSGGYWRWVKVFDVINDNPALAECIGYPGDTK